MSRSDRSRRDAERSARRAKRLAERQKMRAERKAKEAERAARRAERLSERAAGKRRRRTSESEIERSIEDFVDDFTEKWARKAEDWLKSESESESVGPRDPGYDPEYDDDSTERDEVTRSRHRSRGRYRSRRRGSLRSRVSRGRGLYRDSRHKKICGVCAGVADYLEVDRWQVRLVAVLGLIFVPSVALTIYFIAYFLMDDKPYYRQVTDEYEEEPMDDLYEDIVDDNKSATRSRRPTAGMSSGQAMRVAKQKFVDIERRLRAMETHVTSSKFELQRELNQIVGEEPGSSSASS